jgi:hypothetical protein
MFIAGEARLSAELSRKQSNFFSIGYDERPEGCSSVTRKRTFHFRIPPANCVDQKSARCIYEITPGHPFDPAFSWVDAVAAVASADFEAIVHWRERALRRL